jgi:tetratricopeptide (TPR) repeat protein
MRWWYEATHSQPEVGAQILRRIFQDTASPVPLVEGFGIRLDRANIGEHLARLRSGIDDYAIAHPDEVAEVADLRRSLGPRQLPSEYCGDPLLAGTSPPKSLAGLAPVPVDTAAAARHQKRAEELKRRGKREAALEAYDSAIRVSPPNTALYFLRGNLRLELLDPVGALRDFDVGLRLDPGNATLMALRDRARTEAQQRAPVPQAAVEGRAKLAGDRTGVTEDFLAGLKLEAGDTTLQQLSPQVQPR